MGMCGKFLSSGRDDLGCRTKWRMTMNENEKSGYESAKREIQNDCWTKYEAMQYLNLVKPLTEGEVGYIDFDRGHRIAISELANA